MSSLPVHLPYIWIPDSSVVQCHLCLSAFGVMTRKHHCRSCGRVFCHSCCFQYQSLPQYLPRTLSRFCDGKRHRVCNECNWNILHVKRSRDWILIFSYLPVSIKDYVTLSRVSRKWRVASEAVVGVFKSIQYKVSYNKWTGMERRLVLKHWREFTGHSRLMSQAIHAVCGILDLGIVARHYKDQPRACSCIDLHCEVKCSTSFNPYDMLEMTCAFPATRIMECPEMESWIGTSLQHLDHGWLLLLIPMFLQAGFTPAMQRVIANNLLPTVADDLLLTYKLYFEAIFLISSEHKYRGYFRSLLDRFLTMLPKERLNDLDQSERLLYALKTPEHITEYDFKGIRLPFDPHTTVETVHLSRIHRLNTFTAPWVVPVCTSRGEINLLIKHDDLRKDRFVMTVIHMLQSTNNDIALHAYNVLPVTTTYGIVEMVPDCVSLSELNKTTTLTNHVVRNNLNESMGALRQTFLRSCASNAVLGYMLGIGDRNLGNILLHDAELIHIDFSYIFGHDPKNSDLTEMRITPGMVDMLGGKQSPEFQELKRLSSSMYADLKKYTFFWATLFQTLATAEPPIHPFHNNIEDIMQHVETRLIPLATEEEIALKITDVVEQNSGSRLAGWVDSFHSMKSSVEDLMFNFDFGFS